MSRDNVEVVLAAIAAFNRHDAQALADLCTPDFEFTSVLTAVEADGATYRGERAWMDYFERMDETWDEWGVEEYRVFDAGDEQLACVFRIAGRGRTSEAAIGQTIGITYRLREGKLWRMRSYLRPSDALEAVGLTEA
jgi:ketosteroid isomerase-like protein